MDFVQRQPPADDAGADPTRAPGLAVALLEIAAQGRSLLRNVALQVPSPGLVTVLGAHGAGKSLLLRAIAGGDPTLLVDGRVTFVPDVTAALLPAGAPDCVLVDQDLTLAPSHVLGDVIAARAASPEAWLAKHGLDVLVPRLAQPVAALSANERRIVAVLLALETPSPVVLADAVTEGLDATQREIVLQRLAQLSTTRVVVVASADRLDAVALGGRIALVAGGTLTEVPGSVHFLPVSPSVLRQAPATTVAPSPPSPIAEVPSIDEPSRYAASLPRADTPSSPAPLWWVIPGLVGGMGHPPAGALAAWYARLAATGIRVVCSLDAAVPGAREAAARAGIALHHVPIARGEPPRMAQVGEIVRLVDAAIAAGDGFVAQGHDGVIRTATVLACALVWLGDPPALAMTRVRRAQPHAAVTAEQLHFIESFAARIADGRA